MAAAEPLRIILGINVQSISKPEELILEADLFFYLCKALKEYFRKQYSNYFFLLKLDIETEANMINEQYVRWMLEEILLSQEYTLSGIARYTQMPEDFVYEVLIGGNLRPTAIFLERLISLHREIKRELYISIRKKVAEEYLTLYKAV